MVTIKELAEIAGVSPTTVSNVLHGRVNKMSTETLEKVKAAIEEHEYISNMGARILANKGSRIISVVMMYSIRNELNVMHDPFHSEFIGALEHEMREKGYFMMLYTSADVEEGVKMSKMWNAEGLIVLGCPNEDCQRIQLSMDCPVTFVDSYAGDGQGIVNVGLEDRKGAYKMTEYLIRQGHRRIVFLADNEEPIGVDYERLMGFKEALADYGIREEGLFLPISYKVNVRKQQILEFISKYKKEYTALFFAADRYAVDTLNLLQDSGYCIPEDISIAGYDGTGMSEICRPRLTTVKQDVEQKAIQAVNQTVRQIRGEELDEKQIHLSTMLMIRDTVKKI